MRRRRSRQPANRRTIGLLAALALSPPLLATDENFAPDLRAPPPALRSDDLSADTSGDEPVIGIPARSLFRDTGNTFTNMLRQDFQPAAGINAGSVQFQSHFNLGSTNAQLPLFRTGYAPENADLKIGPAYINIDSASAAVLASDNINLTHDHRKAGEVAILEIGATLVLQLADNLQLVGTGYFVDLPLTGQAGFGGGTRNASNFGFALFAFPEFFSQLTWDTNIAGWPVLFSDEFTSGIGGYSLGSPSDFPASFGGGFRGEDRAGHLVFRAPGAPESSASAPTPDLNSTNRDFEYFSNRIGVLTERLFPGDVRLRVQAYHENLWYNQGQRGLPQIREDLHLRIQSERDNLRFQPYLDYDAFRAAYNVSFNQSVALGIQGPITDQLHFDGYVGEFLNARGSDQFIWRARFYHDAGPYTRESLGFGQETSSFQDEIYTYQTYQVSQILGPKLDALATITHDQVKDAFGQFANRDEWLAGFQLRLNAGPKTFITAAGFYTASDSNIHFELWTARISLDYKLSDTFDIHLFYQYQKRDGAGNDNFRENLVLLQLTKTFDRRLTAP